LLTFSKKHSRGFTLIEILLAITIMIGMIAMCVVLINKALRYFNGSRVRQQSSQQARAAVVTMQRVLADAIPYTVIIRTPAPSAQVPFPPPNSEVDFSTATTGGAAYTIQWATNTVHLIVNYPSPLNLTDTVLIKDVSQLSFTTDVRDPSLLEINLRMDVPIDGQTTYTMLLNNQVTRLNGH